MDRFIGVFRGVYLCLNVTLSVGFYIDECDAIQRNAAPSREGDASPFVGSANTKLS